VLFGDDNAFVEFMSERVAKLGVVVNAVDVGPDPTSQLWMMSQCDHCVIANSSFAWWGLGAVTSTGRALNISW
jgi:hypothetical protein